MVALLVAPSVVLSVVLLVVLLVVPLIVRLVVLLVFETCVFSLVGFRVFGGIERQHGVVNDE